MYSMHTSILPAVAQDIWYTLDLTYIHQDFLNNLKYLCRDPSIHHPIQCLFEPDLLLLQTWIITALQQLAEATHK